MRRCLFAAVGVAAGATTAWAQVPAPLSAPGDSEVLRLHAEGSQVYECKADAAGQTAWAFREPIATLMQDGKTIGRHFAGPTWELIDGSAVVGKVVANAPGAAPSDIPWLRLDVASQRGNGALSGVTVIQRVDTHGGKLEGRCERPGALQSVPYAADYVFLKKS